MKICEIEDRWNEIYPDAYRSPWDHDGLLVCPDRERQVKRIVTCLDVSFHVIREAIRRKADLIVSHHPLIFQPLYRINRETVVGQKVIDLMENGLSLISLHTRMDAAPGGLNEAFGTLLGIRPDSSVVLLPEEPFIGGIGDLDRSISPAALAERVSSALSAPVKLYSAGRDVKRIGYCCGAGKDLVLPSLERGADAFVSGDLSYHVVQEAVEKGMTVIDCGHHASEKNAAFLLRDEILKFAPEMEIHPILEPLNGEFVDFSQLFCSNSTT